MAKGNGIESKGKTEGKNFGNSGPTVKAVSLKKGPGGKTNDAMKAVGRNFAKLQANGK
jgi:hypothetical protein